MPRDYDEDYDDDYEDNRYSDRPIRRREREPGVGTASLGIGSFVIALISGVSLTGLVIMAAVMTMNAGGKLDEQSPAAIIAGCGMILSMGLSVLGLILGIVGVMGDYAGKIWAGLGLGLNAVILLGMACLFVIGSVAG